MNVSKEPHHIIVELSRPVTEADLIGFKRTTAVVKTSAAIVDDWGHLVTVDPTN
jgi:hypothetical protein